MSDMEHRVETAHHHITEMRDSISCFHDRRAALNEASRTFNGILWREWARYATDDDIAKCGVLVSKLDPYVCDAAPTSVYAGDDRSNFWRDMVDHYPSIIDFARHLDHSSRLEFFSHLVAFQRFIANSKSKRYESIVDQDRSSILYFILTESEDNVQSLVQLLDGMELRRRHRIGKGHQREVTNFKARPSLNQKAINGLTKEKSLARLEDSKNDPRIALTERFNELEDTVLRVERGRRNSVVIDADAILQLKTKRTSIHGALHVDLGDHESHA